MRYIHLGLLYLLVSLMFGCARHKAGAIAVEPEKLPVKIAGACDQSKAMLEEKLRKSGLKLLSMGQNYLISVPSYFLFPAQSPHLTWESYAVLNDIACYLKQYRKIAITVQAFTNRCISPQHERALTLARARAVGDYLWSQGIDSRFIFTVGHGNDKPIVGFIQGDDNSPNSRIEIIFRNIIA